MRKVAGICCVVAFVLTAKAVLAQNLLSGSNFDTAADITTFWATDDPQVSVAFSSTDFQGSPTSGSAQVTNASATPGNGLGINQCGGAVTAGNFFDYGGRVFIASGQATTGDAQVGLRWWSGANCTGSTVGSQPREQTTTLDTWVSLAAFNQQAPVGAVSVQFLAFPSKVEAGGTLVASFDRLYVGPPGTTPVVLSGFSVD